MHGGENGKVSVVRILFANLNLTFRHTRLLSQSSCYLFVCWLILWEDLSAAKNHAIWIKCEWYKHLCTNTTPSCGINQKHLCNRAIPNILGACIFCCELNVVFSTEFSLWYLFHTAACICWNIRGSIKILTSWHAQDCFPLHSFYSEWKNENVLVSFLNWCHTFSCCLVDFVNRRVCTAYSWNCVLSQKIPAFTLSLLGCSTFPWMHMPASLHLELTPSNSLLVWIFLPLMVTALSWSNIGASSTWKEMGGTNRLSGALGVSTVFTEAFVSPPRCKWMCDKYTQVQPPCRVPQHPGILPVQM